MDQTFLNSLSLARNGFDGVPEMRKSEVLGVRTSTGLTLCSLALLLPGTWGPELVERFHPKGQAWRSTLVTHRRSPTLVVLQQEPEGCADSDADQTLLKIRKPPTGFVAGSLTCILRWF